MMHRFVLSAVAVFVFVVSIPFSSAQSLSSSVLRRVVIDADTVTVSYQNTASSECAVLKVTGTNDVANQATFCSSDGVEKQPITILPFAFREGVSVQLCSANNSNTCTNSVLIEANKIKTCEYTSTPVARINPKSTINTGYKSDYTVLLTRENGTRTGFSDTLKRAKDASTSGYATFTESVIQQAVQANAQKFAGQGKVSLPVQCAKRSTPISLPAVGTLSMTTTFDYKPIEIQQLAGSVSAPILKPTFRATGEDVEVTKMVFTGIAKDADRTSSNIDRLELYKNGVTTPFAFATVGGCGNALVPNNSFCTSSSFTISQGVDTTIDVKIRFRTDTDGARSGDYIQIAIIPSFMEARGVQSFNAISATGQANVSLPMTLVLSKITSITSVDPNANGTVIPIGTNRAIGQFKFTAPANSNFKNGQNKFVLDTLIFTVDNVNIDIDSTSYKMYNKADPTATVTCTVHQSNSTTSLVTCANVRDSSIDSSIGSGTDTTFVLSATIRNSKVSSSSTSTLQVSLQNLNNIDATSVSDTTSHIRWFDADAVSSREFFGVWFSNENVINTPINGTQYQN